MPTAASPGYVPAPRPQVLPPARWRFPAPERAVLDNGLTVLAHHLPGQPVAAVTCHLAIPTAAEPDGLAGVAGIMAGAVPGTGRRDSRAGELAMAWSARAAHAGPVISCQLPAGGLPGGLALLAEALARPALGREETGCEVRQVLAGIAAAEADPGAWLTWLLPAAVWGEGTRAGLPPCGTPATLARITGQAVRDFHDARARPAAATVVIAGDLSGLDPGAVSAALGGWQDTRPAPPPPAPVQLPAGPPAAILAAAPPGPQVRLLLAARVPGRGHEDWAPLAVAAHILGAPLTGWLDARLRGQAGHAYHVGAQLREDVPGSGLLAISGAVGAGHAISDLQEILTMAGTVAREGFTAAEVSAVIGAFTRQAPLARESAADVAAVSAGLAACGLPPGYLGTLLDEVAALTPARVNAAARQYLDPAGLTVLAAGDPAALQGPLTDLVSPVPLRVIRAGKER